ncbi:MAG: hypothetical protein GF398_16230 [Chitinivibrionales bacterium]|nr:hypothetical protein [Chitinivibrionales bacterium]
MSNFSDSFTHHSGAMHLHTTNSDGGVELTDLVSAARSLELDYIVVTDHMSLTARKLGHEGFYDNLFVSIGYEHNDSNNTNHYLALGVPRIASEKADPQKYIDQIKGMGGYGFLAHPMEQRHYFKQLPPYPWTDWSVSGFDGIELWNQMSDWVENLKRLRSFIRIFFPRRFMSNAPPALLQKWDELGRQRFIAAVGGVDAHSHSVNWGLIHFTLFPVKVELKGIRTHLFLPRALREMSGKQAGAALVTALRDGRGFISNFRRGEARTAEIYLQTAQGELLPPGAVKRNRQLTPATLHVQVPEKATIRLIRNGVCVAARSGMSEAFGINDTGLYRVEVYKGKHAWIYSNHFPVGNYPL